MTGSVMERILDDVESTDPTALGRPNLARATNYLVGGGANFAADRAAVQTLLAMDPGVGDRFRASRAFVGRAVRTALDRGCDQFVDLGSGIPSPGGLHSLVGLGSATVVYVDVDPVAIAHACELLEGPRESDRTAAVRADLRDASRVLDEVLDTGLVDLDRPVTLVCNAVLQWIADSDADDLAAVLERYREALAPGSLLALSVPHPDLLDGAEADEVPVVIEAAVAPLRLRRRREVTRILGAWEILPPGVVDVVDWPVATGAEPVGYYGVCATRR
ncbi:SAM-dependent methyltransferase [Actinomycetospora chiangmaiensis]|uniref:SAM-dependent methyltransferase n=1 Tax=Actinomycetospora chiangmaiensis TaxID=402650 RepID=UPI0012FA0477|nr:SAM-dependent methyltransferase [Actinomycetospora chiangmaiensis]